MLTCDKFGTIPAGECEQHSRKKGKGKKTDVDTRLKTLLFGWHRANRLINSGVYKDEDKKRLMSEMKIVKGILDSLPEKQAEALIYSCIERMYPNEIQDLMCVEHSQFYRYKQRGEHNFIQLLKQSGGELSMLTALGNIRR